MDFTSSLLCDPNNIYCSMINTKDNYCDPTLLHIMTKLIRFRHNPLQLMHDFTVWPLWAPTWFFTYFQSTIMITNIHWAFWPILNLDMIPLFALWDLKWSWTYVQYDFNTIIYWKLSNLVRFTSSSLVGVEGCVILLFGLSMTWHLTYFQCTTLMTLSTEHSCQIFNIQP